MADDGADDDLAPPPPDADPVANLGDRPLLSRLLKTDDGNADSHPVNESIGARSRVNRSPVTDTGGGSPDTGKAPASSKGGFSFDLGAAMARLGSDTDTPETTSEAPAADDEPEAAQPAAHVAPAAPQPPPPTVQRPGVPQQSPAESPTEPPADVPKRQPAQLEEIPEAPPQPIRPYAERHHGPGQVFNLAAAMAEQKRQATSPSPPTETRTRPLGAVDRTTIERRQPEQPVAAPDVPPLPRRGAPTPQPEHRVEPAMRSEPVVRSEPVSPAFDLPDAAATEAPGRSYVATNRSVFDDAQSRTPGTPTGPVEYSPVVPATPVVPPATPAASPVSGSGIPSASAAAPTVPGYQPGSGIPVLPSVPTLPTLPPAAPMAPPPMAASAISALPDVTTVRAAQARAKKQQKRGGKLVGRALLIIVVLGLLVAGVLTFGRSRLFPESWDAALTPLVDQIQEEQGIEFDHPVPLVRQPADEYAATVNRLLLGSEWLGRVPEWRALGLVAGDPTADQVGAAITPRRLAVYDPDADRIYLLADADPALDAQHLRVALEAAYASSTGRTAAISDTNQPTVLGVSSIELIAERAVSAYVANSVSPAVPTVAGVDVSVPGVPVPTSVPSTGDVAVATPDATAPNTALPLPIEYELTAVDALGQALLTAGGANPADAGYGAELADGVVRRLDDGAAVTSAGLLAQGDQAVGQPVALGIDDWSLVWGTRLSGDVVAQLATVVGADSYQAFDRGGVTCVAAVFETRSSTDAGLVLSAMATWAAAGPAQSQAAASSLSDTRVQLVTCDPGVNAATAPQFTSVADVIQRQIARLEAAPVSP